MVDLNITYRFITTYEYGVIEFVLLQENIVSEEIIKTGADK